MYNLVCATFGSKGLYTHCKLVLAILKHFNVSLKKYTSNGFLTINTNQISYYPFMMKWLSIFSCKLSMQYNCYFKIRWAFFHIVILKFKSHVGHYRQTGTESCIIQPQNCKMLLNGDITNELLFLTVYG